MINFQSINKAMKTLIIFLAAASLFATPIVLPKFSIKYSQIFAERTIVLTEELTLAESWALPNKKGFIRFENEY